MRVGVGTGVVWLVLLGVVAPAAAWQASSDPRKESEYARPLEAVDPALAKLFHDGTAALYGGRLAEARASFEKVQARVPDHAPTLRRLSYALVESGDPARALPIARRAREIEPGREGDLAVANALRATASSPEVRSEASELAERLLAGEPDAGEAIVAAEIAARLNDLGTLGRGVAVLERLAPTDLATGYLGALYYAASGDLDKAETALERAEAAGLSRDKADELRADTGIARHRAVWRGARVAAWAFGLWLLGLGVIFVVGRLMSAAALRAIERHAADRGDALVAAARSLRRVYKLAIGIAAVYYYISIPVVIAIVLGAAGGIVYGIFMLGYIPIKLVILLVLGAAFTVWALARSLFTRRAKDEDPGRRLPEAEAPALWAVLREVAAQVGTRPVDDVFLTPGTEVAVTERGSMAARLRDRGRRFLILGVGVLDGMSERQLRAILAHEHGHFSNRDTAGGDLASRVRASLFLSIIGVAKSGGASVLNPAWHFLRLFFTLFQRITLGASRLQEVLADRFSASLYGGAVFAEGLRHSVRRSVEFAASSGVAIQRAREQQRAIANLYAVEEGAVDPKDVEAETAKALADPGSPYDSHPPVERRIVWVSTFPAPDGAPIDGPAWGLFPDRARVEAEMTGTVNERIGVG